MTALQLANLRNSLRSDAVRKRHGEYAFAYGWLQALIKTTDDTDTIRADAEILREELAAATAEKTEHAR